MTSTLTVPNRNCRFVALLFSNIILVVVGIEQIISSVLACLHLIFVRYRYN